MQLAANIDCSNCIRLALALVLSSTTVAAQETPGSPNTKMTDSANWVEYTRGQGPTLSKTGNRLRVAIPGSASGEQINGGYVYGCDLRGDFDIQVDFRLDEWPFENGVRLSMAIPGAAMSRFSLGQGDFLDDEPRERYAMDFGGGSISLADASDSAGRLRMTRIGGELTGYYQSGGGWVPLRSGVVSTDDTSLALGLHLPPNVFGKQNVSATFENFIVNNGQCAGDEFRAPELAGVEIVDPNTLDPIENVAIGQSFKVRLTYAEDPDREITETVTVRTSRGASQEVRVTGDTRVIVSAPVLVAPAGQ